MRLIASMSFGPLGSSRFTCRSSFSFVVEVFFSRCFVVDSGGLALFQHARRALTLTPKSWAFNLAHSGTFEPTGVWGSTVVAVGYRLAARTEGENTLLPLTAVNTAVPVETIPCGVSHGTGPRPLSSSTSWWRWRRGVG